MIVWISSSAKRGGGALLLDRDGVINQDRPDFVKRWEEFAIFPDALEALRQLRHLGLRAILVSNQSGLNRGIIDWKDFRHIHEGMVETIRRAGGRLDGALYCPHRPGENCSCRKPRPGMILEAANVFRIDLRRTYFIGDRQTDLEAAAAAGAGGVLLDRSSRESQASKRGTVPIFHSLSHAVTHLFRHRIT